MSEHHHHPSTPPNATVSLASSTATLWSSPVFSDYFSGADEDPNSPHKARTDEIKARNPVQLQIITRLNDIGRKISLQDGSQTPNLADFDAELEQLQNRLIAPESQTRGIIEEESSGIFDDEEDPAVLQAENAGLRRQVRDSDEVVDRITKLTASLQGRLDETKKTNELAEEKLNAAYHQIESLTDQNSTLTERNKAMHEDLRTAIPSIKRLHAHLKVIEAVILPAVDDEMRDRYQADLSRWEQEWADAKRDFQNMSTKYSRLNKTQENGNGNIMSNGSGIGTPKGNGTGKSSQVEDKDQESEATSAFPATGHRSRIILRRGGLIRRLDLGPDSSAESESGDEKASSDVAIESDEEGDYGDAVGESNEEGYDADERSVLVKPHEEDEDGNSTLVEEEGSSDEEEDAKPQRSAWGELWDSLAEFTGIRDYNDFQ